MKREVLRFAIMAMALWTAGALRAQEVATLSGTVSLQDAVVRQYTDEQSVYYCSDTRGDHYFVLYDITHPTSAIVAQFPFYLEVHEFEIYKEKVYFCGTFPRGGDPWGMVGQISIADLFYNNGPYNIAYVNSSSSGVSTDNTHLTSCDRMDVFEGGGHVHMAIVAEMAHSQHYGNLRRTACDIWYNDTIWQGRALYQKYDFYRTSDITSTESSVVVTAYDDDLKYSLLLVFKKMAGFPDHPVYPYTIKIMDCRHDNNILVERLSGEDVAVAHYFYDSVTLKEGTAVHHIGQAGSLLPPAYHFSLHYNHNLEKYLIDMRYNEGEDALLLLHDIKSPLWTVDRSTLFDFEAYNLSSLAADAWHYGDDVQLLSVDNRVLTSSFSLGGNYNPWSEALLTQRDKTQAGCYQPVEFHYDNVTPYVVFSTGVFDENVMNCYVLLDNPLPNPESNAVNVICEQTRDSHE